jgi:hypothetical protein
VFILAIIFAYLARLPDNDDDDEDDDVEVGDSKWNRHPQQGTVLVEIMDDLIKLQLSLKEMGPSNVGTAATPLAPGWNTCQRPGGPEIHDSNKVLKERAKISTFLSGFFLRLVFLIALTMSSLGYVRDQSSYFYNVGIKNIFSPESDQHFVNVSIRGNRYPLDGSIILHFSLGQDACFHNTSHLTLLVPTFFLHSEKWTEVSLGLGGRHSNTRAVR